MIDKETEAKIKDSIDIVDIISDYMELKKRGVNYIGLCPFHDDQSPSFYVSPNRGTWHCFVCDEGGDAISFLMKKLHITYPETLKLLADKYNIPIPQKYIGKEEWIKQKEKESMFATNEATMQYYESCLETSDEGIGIAYFRKRGFTDEIIHKFHVGYAPKDSDVIGKIKEKGLNMKYLMPENADITFKSGKTLHVDNGTGIVYQSNGRFLDTFSRRVIFPWFNTKGQVVAFGGRKLDAVTKGVEMKYRNSLESLLYHKGQELWGLYQAKVSILKANAIYIAEGYTDVMMLHQIGIENVVSNSGTSLSEDQVTLLSRFTKNVILLYDSDKAGIMAANRAIPILLQKGMNVSVVLLPEGEDPDSFVRQHTTEDVQEYLSTHKQNFVAFMNDVLLKDNNDPVSMADAINTILDNINLVKDKILKELYIKELAKTSGIKEDVLINR